MENKKNTPTLISTAIENFHEYLFNTIDGYKKTSSNSDVVQMLTLDNDYDNPDSVLQAADAVAMLYAYYATLFHSANNKMQDYDTMYRMKKSSICTFIKNKLFNNNIKNGMTANNAKPTANDIENYFNKNYVNKGIFLKLKRKLNSVSEDVSQLRIMRDTIDKRQQAIQVISSLLGKCIDRGLIVPRLGKSNKKFKRHF